MLTLDNYIKEGLFDKKSSADKISDAALDFAREEFRKAVFEPSESNYQNEFRGVEWEDFKNCITLDSAGEMHIDLSNYRQIEVLLLGYQAKTPQLKICEIISPWYDEFSFFISMNYFSDTKGIFSPDCRLDCSLWIQCNSRLKTLTDIPEIIYGEFNLYGNIELYQPFEPRTPEQQHEYIKSLMKPLPKYCHFMKISQNCHSITSSQRTKLRKIYPDDKLELRGGILDWEENWNKVYAEAVRDHLKSCPAKTIIYSGLSKEQPQRHIKLT